MNSSKISHVIKLQLFFSLSADGSLYRGSHSLLISFHSFMFWASICCIWVTFQHRSGWPHVTHLSETANCVRRFNSVYNMQK